MKSMFALAASVLALVAGVPAQSAIVFNLSGVTFDDGGTAAGSFTTNDAVTTITDFSVATSGGTFYLFGIPSGFGIPVDGFTFNSQTAIASLTGSNVTFTESGGIFFARILNLSFDPVLTASTTTISSGGEGSFIVGRGLATGQLSVGGGQAPGGPGGGGPGSGGPTPGAGAVPEPATWAMMIGGVGAIGGVLRRRRSQVRTTVRFA